MLHAHEGEHPQELVGRFRAASRAEARLMVADITSRCPDGYSVEVEAIRKPRTPAGRSKGAGVEATVIIRQTNRTFPTLSVEEWANSVGLPTA